MPSDLHIKMKTCTASLRVLCRKPRTQPEGPETPGPRAVNAGWVKGVLEPSSSTAVKYRKYASQVTVHI